MKKMFALLLFISLLFSTALADVASQVGAPATYQADYYSNTKKTNVHVDAVVYVPDVKAINTYAVTGRDVTLADTKAVALAAAPETDWLTDWQPEPLGLNWSGNRDDYTYDEPGESGYWGYDLRFNWYPMHDGPAEYAANIWACNSFKETVFGSRRFDTKLDYDYTVYEKGISVFFPARAPYLETVEETPDPDQKLSKQTLTWGEATAMAEAFIGQVSSEFTLSWIGQCAGEGTNRRAYAFQFSRVIDGVPVTYTSHSVNGASADEQQYSSPPRTEAISCAIDQERIVGVRWDNPWEIGEVISEDVKLLPFDKIMEVFGAIAPLSIQNMENENQAVGGKSNRWEIKEIRLGYMPVLRKDNSGEWELRPVWDFIGIRSFAHEYYNWPGNSALTIDAIDGTVIDRRYGY